VSLWRESTVKPATSSLDLMAEFGTLLHKRLWKHCMLNQMLIEIQRRPLKLSSKMKYKRLRILSHIILIK
jgi:hypothetical protein